MSDEADLRNRVGDLLHDEWDPIAVSQFPGAEHEYDSYVPEVCRLVASGARKEEIFQYLWCVETEHMGLRGDRRKTEQTAERAADMGAGTRSE